jgi:hypothetical protein
LIAFLIAAVLWTAFATPAFAGPGHAHDDSAVSASPAATPRFGTHSDLFELVGVLDGETVTIYLDRYATNEPITDARIEVDAAGQTTVAAPAPDGTYRMTLAGVSKPGRHLMTFTIAHGAEADLLEGAFDVVEATQINAIHGGGRTWLYAVVGAAILSVVIGIALMRGRRRGAAR